MTIHFSIAPDQIRNAWAIYLLRDHTGALQFVGCCRLAQIASTSDARANALFGQFFPAGQLMTVEVIAVEFSKTAARNRQWAFLRDNGRPFMQQAGRAYRGTAKQPVICVTTGEQFTSISEAAERHGIAQSQLSNHLLGKTGFVTVKGKTYRYGVAVPLHSHIPAVPLHSHIPEGK